MRVAGALALALLPATFAHAETLDRIAVTVDRHVITESDVLLDLRISAFLDGTAPDVSGLAKRKAAERLVDLFLVLQDATVTRAPQPAPAEIDTFLAPVRARYASQAEYLSALASAGLSESQVRDHLFAGLRMMRYTDLRFRPEVPITEQDLHDAFAELTTKRPASVPGSDFEANRPQLEEFVINRRVLEALDRWLVMTRTELQILYRDAAFQ
jgi:hypothetical protein